VPTTTELAPTSLEGGFDTSLDPERILGVEIGAKGLLRERILYDAAVFALRIRNALIPFQDDEGRNRARNAGDVRRQGFELGVSALLHPWLSLRLAYTYSRFRYRDFDVIRGGDLEEFDGNREPNVPEHHATAELRFAHPEGWFATLALRHFSDIETDDANTSESDGATIADFRAGYEWRAGDLVVQPFFGARNWTGAEYDGTLRPNAFGGRYYEPAPETEIYSGLELRFRR
jgi:iron complex outermembrane receptor protein